MLRLSFSYGSSGASFTVYMMDMLLSGGLMVVEGEEKEEEEEENDRNISVDTLCFKPSQLPLPHIFLPFQFL